MSVDIAYQLGTAELLGRPKHTGTEHRLISTLSAARIRLSLAIRAVGLGAHRGAAQAIMYLRGAGFEPHDAVEVLPAGGCQRILEHLNLSIKEDAAVSEAAKAAAGFIHQTLHTRLYPCHSLLSGGML